MIASAASNAERADNLKRADLYVSQACGPGRHDPTDPPARQGRLGSHPQRSSHITVVAEPRTEHATRGQATTRSKEK